MCKIHLQYPITHIQTCWATQRSMVETCPWVWLLDLMSRRVSDSWSQGHGFDPHPGRGVVSLSKTLHPHCFIVLVKPRSKLSQNDWKIVDRDVKSQTNKQIMSWIFFHNNFSCTPDIKAIRYLARVRNFHLTLVKNVWTCGCLNLWFMCSCLTLRCITCHVTSLLSAHATAHNSVKYVMISKWRTYLQHISKIKWN